LTTLRVFFDSNWRYTILRDPFGGGVKYTEYNASQPLPYFISETVRDRPIVTTEHIYRTAVYTRVDDIIKWHT